MPYRSLYVAQCRVTGPEGASRCPGQDRGLDAGLGLVGKTRYIGVMESAALTRELVVARLAGAEPQIRALGVARLALFGSIARNEGRPDSDVDLLVQFSPGQKSYGRFIALTELLESLLPHRVELVTTEALSPFLGPRILAEAHDVLRAA